MAGRNLFAETQEQPIVGRNLFAETPQPTVPPQESGGFMSGVADIAGGVGETFGATAELAGQAATALPSSAYKLASGIGEMFMSPVDTVQTMGEIVFGGAKKLVDIPLGDEEKFDSVVEHFKGKYGSLEGLNQAIGTDPASVMLDASIVLTGGGSALAKVPQMAKVGEAVAATGRVAEPLGAVGKVATKAVSAADRLAMKVAEEGVGLATGSGPGAVRQALESTGLTAKSNDFVRAMRGGSSGEEVLGVAKDALSEIKETNAATYRGRLDKIAQSQKNIDTRPIKSRLQKLLDSRGVQVLEDGTLDFSRSTIGRNAVSDVEDIVQTVSEWGTRQGDNTAIGLDVLKRRLDDFYSESKSSRALVTDLRNTVKKEIIKSVPEYKQMVGDYEQIAKFTNEVERSLSLNNKAMLDTTIRKLMSSPRETFKFRNELIRQMDEMTGGSLSKEIAGVSMQEALPKGLVGKLYGGGLAAGGVSGGIAPPVLIAMASTASPRLMGELLNTMGFTRKQAVSFIKKSKEGAGVAKPGARAIAGEVSALTDNQSLPIAP